MREFVIYNDETPTQMKHLIGQRVSMVVVFPLSLTVVIEFGDRAIIVHRLPDLGPFAPLEITFGTAIPGSPPLTSAPDCEEIPELKGATFTGLEETVLAFGPLGLRFAEDAIKLCKRTVN